MYQAGTKSHNIEFARSWPCSTGKRCGRSCGGTFSRSSRSALRALCHRGGCTGGSVAALLQYAISSDILKSASLEKPQIHSIFLLINLFILAGGPFEVS